MKKSAKIGIIVALVLVLSLALAAAAAFIVWDRHEYTLSLVPQGEMEITLEVGTDYTDPGATAQVYGSIFDKESQSVPVVVSGSVDTQKVGTYEIAYSAQYSKEHFLGDKQASGQAVRKVHVVDTQVPSIQLSQVEGSYTLPGHPYEEEGFTASDNYDGDLSAQVIREERDGKVYYTVADSSGNETQAVRDIFYDDPIPPEIALVGEAEVEVIIDEEYQELGCMAVDNLDGDISEKVAVTGQVDNTTLGEYVITYTITDAYGNEAQVQRLVKVIKKPLPPIPAGVGGVIYLTFDDGPSGHTARLLDILDKYNVKATFFVVGYKDMSMVAEIAARGHSVGNHTYSHDYAKLYATQESFFDELYATESRIESATGVKTSLIRFPGGSSNSVSTVSMKELTQAVEAAGYYYFDWNVDSRDAGGASSSDEVYYYVCSGVAPRSCAVVLQHDIKGFSVDAVERIILWGLENGYTFLPLDTSSPGAHHNVKS